jgi:hypothetical protein
MQTPFPQSYWIRDGLLCAGHYPGDLNPRVRDSKLAGLLDCGIRRVVNLIPRDETGAHGLPFDPYEPHLRALAAARGVPVECLRMGFPDGQTPDRATMNAILDRLDASIAAGEAVYIHCWGGHGRTSTVAGCYLVRHGMTPQAAIEQILAWRSTLPRRHHPFEPGQEAYVRAWRTATSAA